MKKEDLIPGRWYTGSQWQKGSCCKMITCDNGLFEFTEGIYDGKYTTHYTKWFSNLDRVKEVPLSEIQHLLPYKVEPEEICFPIFN